jgi:hypothetical protein
MEIYRGGDLIELIDVDPEKGMADIRFLDQAGGVVTVDVSELSTRDGKDGAGLEESKEEIRAAILSALLFISAQLLLYVRFFEARPRIAATLRLIQSSISKARKVIQQT